MTSVDGPGERYLFWEQRTGDDLRGSEPVAYRIEGHGTGMFLWYPKQVTTGLCRYDLNGSGFPRGAVLLRPEQRIGWFASERPDRCVMRGSEDPGHPIERAAAEAIALYLGYASKVLDEPTSSSNQWPNPSR